LAKNAEIKKFRSYLEAYSKNLYQIEESLHHFPNNQLNYDSDPINFEAIPYEQGSLLQLVRTDNKVLNKIVTVFAALISEMDILAKEGENKYCWGLLFYGEGPEAIKDKGENLILMGKFISFLQVNFKNLI
jgi:WASH complex subunit 7